MNTFIYIVYSVWCNADFKHCDLICHTAFLDLDNSYTSHSPRMGSGAWDYPKGEYWQGKKITEWSGLLDMCDYVITASMWKQTRTHTRTHARTHARTHTRTRARARTHAHAHMHTHLKSFHFFTYMSKRRWWFSFSPPSIHIHIPISIGHVTRGAAYNTDHFTPCAWARGSNVQSK